VDSILCQKGVRFEVFVIDNFSSDDTLRKLEVYGIHVQVIRNPQNIGFGRAHNQSLARAKGRFFHALNPDAWLVSDDTHRELVQSMEESPDAGLMTTHIEGQQQPPVELLYPGERHLRDPLGPLPGEIAWVLGANMFARKSCLDVVRGFDESFFLYSEETDLCLRLRKAGYEIECASHLCVGHVGGASESGSASRAVWVRKMAGLYLFYSKHYTPRDFKRLLRRDYNRSRFRLWLASLGLTHSPANENMDKYTAIRDTSRECLSRIHS